MSHEAYNLREQVGFFQINSRYLAQHSTSETPKAQTTTRKKPTVTPTKKPQVTEGGWEDF
jgi:hypothetical protein